MEVAGEFFEKGYHVYYWPQIYRYPNDPKLSKKKYVSDLLAIKNDDYVLIEIGFCDKEKLLDLKRLVPSAKVLHITQWKNFCVYEGLKQISGYTVELPPSPKRKNSNPHRWTIEETKKIISLVKDGKSYLQIHEAFSNYNYGCIHAFIRRLYLLGSLATLPHATVGSTWTITELEELKSLYLKGMGFRDIAKNFPRKKYSSIVSKIQHLHLQKKMPYRKYIPDWTATEDELLAKLWIEGTAIKQIQMSPEFSIRSIDAIITRVRALRKRGLITFCRLPIRKNRIWNPEADDLLCTLVNSQKSDGEISNYYPSRTYNNVRNRIKYLREKGLVLKRRVRKPA
jgi:hypothetical protein